MGLGGGLGRLLGNRLGLIDQRGAVFHVEAQLLQAGGKMRWQIGHHIQRCAIRMLDDQAARVKVHLAADAARKERVGPAILTVAYNRMADCRHVDAQLMGAPGLWLQFDPGGAVACMVDHPVAGAGGLALSAFIDHHLLAAGAGLLGQRQIDEAILDRRNPGDQRPIDLARRAPRKALGKERRAARSARDQQHARGILVEPVNQPRARSGAGVVKRQERIEQPVNMLAHSGAALGGKSRRLVEHDRGAVLRNHHRLGLTNLFLGQGPTRQRPLALGRGAAGGDAQDLARSQPVIDRGALAIHPDLPGPRPARDHGEADQRQMALEPAVQPHPIVVRLNGELAYRLADTLITHAIILRPAIRPITPPTSDSAA